ncbi:acetate/propionate family kinase [Collimonas sp.]|jgi:acetate kinase|uniref:acetate/propionate family kinase n=1 Tax=Collimonas sp. TaxID=1963772 RepID=UPI002BC715B3|nr:acetate/propionate family kinase [Collimonas sp.]HWX02418.1 acetate/propionate family kinase [Collimonas sp.]
MNPANANVLTINGGSSSIKFALFGPDQSSKRLFAGRIEGVGLSQGAFIVKSASPGPGDNFSHPVAVPDHAAAVKLLMDWLAERIAGGSLAAVAHRIVHGGAKYWQPQRITPQMIEELHQLSPFDPEHLPEEILLAEAFHRRFPDLPQIACFDTAFHHDMPRLAQLLPIPRRYQAKGARRYGFHGLSCAYLMHALEREAGAAAAQGRVILAHLGNGASITAVRAGSSMDTSMGLTPASGLPMSSRSGDLDPGLAWYLARTEQMSARQFHHMVNHEAGLAGISETSSDMRELLRRQAEDVRAAEAIALFCYQARKWICAMAGVLEGLDTLVFAGGIGENAAEVRSRICSGLNFIGIDLDEASNQAGAASISSAASAVSVRVIATDEESMIAQDAYRVLGQHN